MGSVGVRVGVRWERGRENAWVNEALPVSFPLNLAHRLVGKSRQDNNYRRTEIETKHLQGLYAGQGAIQSATQGSYSYENKLPSLDHTEDLSDCKFHQ